MARLKLNHEHPWDVSLETAREIQQDLARHVSREDDVHAICQRVAGIDIGFEDQGKTTKAAVVVLGFPELQLLESAVVRQATAFPYVPGFLSFREVPAALTALAQLSELPDLLVCDGQGIAHPRRLGLASHLGVITGIATIGAAKSRLVGTHLAPAETKGAWSPLVHQDECVGAVLRTRTAVKPLYVSIGHKISLDTAIHRVLACTPRYRLPETTRRAHHLASVADRP